MSDEMPDIIVRDERFLRQQSMAFVPGEHQAGNVQEIMKTMLTQHRGLGLAAIQIGIPIRIICIRAERGIRFFFNPVIIDRRGERKWKESCLSNPKWRGTIVRPNKITFVHQAGRIVWEGTGSDRKWLMSGRR